MDQTKKLNRPTNPRQNANIFSIISFSYMIPTIIKGNLGVLDVNDVPKTLEEHCASELGDKFEKVWHKEKRSSKPSLWRAIGKVFSTEFTILYTLLAADELFVKIIRLIALIQLLKYYAVDAEDKIDEHDALIYAGVTIGSSLVSSFILHITTFNLQLLGMKIKGCM